ncbi:MAG: tryptophan synthase subunit alpha [Candidatus Bathyarchaeia archaeon]
MRRLEDTFTRLRDRKEAALVGFMVGGIPYPEASFSIVEAILRGGVDILELGIPFSDPIADGPTIQAASVRALKAGTNPFHIIELARRIRDRFDIPIILFTYFNPMFKIGVERFSKAASRAGVDGLVIPDLPVEEAACHREAMRSYGLDTIFMAAPSSRSDRLERIIQVTSGFLYLISTYGVTGVREKLGHSTIRLVRNVHTQVAGRIPLAVGFGISKREHVELLTRSGAEGIVVGSAFVKILQEHIDNLDNACERLEAEASTFKAGTYAAREGLS